MMQKDIRKLSVLYCLEACDKDMVYSFLMKNVTSEIGNTRQLNWYAIALQNLLVRKGKHPQLQYPAKQTIPPLKSDTVDFGGI